MSSLFYGPINKNLYTQQYEFITKCLLKDPSLVEFSYLPNNGTNELIANINNVELNVSNILHKMDFNHISLNLKDSQQYINSPYSGSYPAFEHYNGHNTGLNPKYKDLSQGEISAIKYYTSGCMSEINAFLFTTKVNPFNNPQSFGAQIVLHTAMLASGLNKIAPTLMSQESYRGETLTPDQYQERMEIMLSNNGIDKNSAFLSTSNDRSVANCFSNGSLIKFDNLYGKDIKGLSYFPGENEFLLTPGKLQWTSHQVGEGLFNEMRHEFKATVINPLEVDSDTLPDALTLDTFKNLLDWGQEQGISDDFVTTFWKSALQGAEEEISNNSADYLNEILPKESTDTLDIKDIISVAENSIEPALNASFEHNLLNNNTVTPAQHQASETEINNNLDNNDDTLGIENLSIGVDNNDSMTDTCNCSADANNSVELEQPTYIFIVEEVLPQLVDVAIVA